MIYLVLILFFQVTVNKKLQNTEKIYKKIEVLSYKLLQGKTVRSF